MSMIFTSYQYENFKPVVQANTPYGHYDNLDSYDNLARFSVNGDHGYSERGGYELSIADERFTVGRDTWGYNVQAKSGAIFGRDELGALSITVTATKAGQVTTGIFTVNVTPPGGGDHDIDARYTSESQFRSRGTDDDDEIAISSYRYFLHAGDGDDTIISTSTADGGSYLIFGGRGNDIYDGGEGADYLIYGGSGDDYIYGGGGGDYLLRGGVGNDHIYGGDGDDRKLYGGSGDDKIYGGGGDDFYLYGGSGHDVIDGGNGDDYGIYGWTGNDIFVLSQGYDTVIDFKQGEDKIGIRGTFNFETDVRGNIISNADGTMVLERFSGTLTRDDFVVFDGSNFVPTPETVPTTITLNSDASKIAEADDVVETALTEVILAGGDTAGYTFTTDDARFAVDNGVLSIVAGSDFDYEAGATIEVTVTAAKADSDTLDATYALTLTDVKAEFEAIASKPTGGATGAISLPSEAITEQAEAAELVIGTPEIEYINHRVSTIMDNIKFTFDRSVEEGRFNVVGIFDEDVAIAEKLEVKKIGTDDGKDIYNLQVKEGQTFEYDGNTDYLNIEYDGEYVGGGAVVIDIY